MGVDLYEWRVSAQEAVTSGFWNGVDWFQNLSFGDVGIILVTIGVVWAVDNAFRRRRKGKIVVRQGERKTRDILTQVINDGLFEAEHRGEISTQEVKLLYVELADKLDLPDLIPKKYRAQIVKREIKARLANGFYETKPTIPSPVPDAPKASKFRTTIGRSFMGPIKRPTLSDRFFATIRTAFHKKAA